MTETGLPPDLPYGPAVMTIIGAEAGTVFAGLIESDAQSPNESPKLALT